MKKKIIIVGPTFPYRGGNSLFVTFLYENLSKNYDVIIFNYKLLYPKLLFPGKTQFDLSNEVKKIDSIRIINSINPLNWIKVSNLINKINPDLLIFDWWHPYFAFCHFVINLFLRKEIKNKIVFITENFISHEKNPLENYFSRLGLYFAKYFIVLSKKVENDLKKISGRRKIFRSELPIYNHLNINKKNSNELRQSFGYSNDDNVILFFGYVRKYKGLDLLIESIKLVNNIKPELNVKLLVAGEFYDDKTEYLKLIDNHNLQRQIKIFDQYISNEKVIEYFNVADLVVLPYRSATQSGILNLAYGFNKPVVVTNVGGLSEFVTDGVTGIIAANPTKIDICNAILKFFELKNEIDFEKNIREFCSRNIFSNFNEIIESILKEIENNR
jgi:glycosyltransferase involved in cell wall biosynthesis